MALTKRSRAAAGLDTSSVASSFAGVDGMRLRPPGLFG
jgi:hypothetical protein